MNKLSITILPNTFIKFLLLSIQLYRQRILDNCKVVFFIFWRIKWFQFCIWQKKKKNIFSLLFGYFVIVAIENNFYSKFKTQKIDILRKWQKIHTKELPIYRLKSNKSLIFSLTKKKMEKIQEFTVHFF